MSWQPIDTAPKDRALFLASDNTFSFEEPFYGVWRGYWADGIFMSFEGQPLYDVTHWMPIAETPREA